MAAINDAEKELIPQFRERIADIVKPSHDDFYLVRWLRARSHDLTKSENMYRKSMAWRSQIGADNIRETFDLPLVIQKYYPGGQCGHHKDGNPVSIDTIGRMDLRGIIYSVKRTDIVKKIVCQCETAEDTCKRRSKELGRPISQNIQILDFEGFGRSHLWKPGADMYIELVQIVEDNYPELLKKTYIVNTPIFFHMCWAFISKFMSEATRNKFHLLGSDWREVLRSELVPEELPVNWGGDATGPNGDPYCSHLINLGGQIPKEYYQSKENFFPKGVDLQNMTIPANCPITLSYHVEAKSAIRYFFCTDSGDLRFAIYYSSGTGEEPLGDMRVIEPESDISCSKIPQDGLCVCDQPGTYVFWLSNCKGWGSYIFSRTLTYYIEVLDDASQVSNEAQSQDYVASV